MSIAFKLIPIRRQGSKTIDTVLIAPPEFESNYEVTQKKLELTPSWKSLRHVDRFWQKRGWYLFETPDGILHYRFAPSAEDYLEILLEDLRSGRTTDITRSYQCDRTAQLSLLDDLMELDQQTEESLLSNLWEAIRRAILWGLILADEKILQGHLNKDYRQFRIHSRQ